MISRTYTRCARAKGPKRLAAVLSTLTVGVMLGLATHAHAQPNEYAIKAGFVKNFLALTTFPDSVTQRFADTGAKLCVSSEEAPLAAFDALSKGSVKKISLQKVQAGFDASCDVGFLSKGSSTAERDAFEKLSANSAFLGIVERDEDLTRMGIISFFTKSRKIRFKVYKPRLDKSELRLSSQLLRLAEIEKE